MDAAGAPSSFHQIEVCGESGGLICCNSCCRHAFIEQHRLSPGQMHGQTLDHVRLAVHVEGKEAPATLRWTDVARIDEVLHLVAHDNLDRSSIMTLVDIFIQIFHGANRGADVDVNVTLEAPHQVRIIRNDPPVVQCHTIFLHTSAGVSTTIDRVLVLRQGRFLSKVVRETFGADALCVHARLVSREQAARTMHQQGRDKGEELDLLRVAVVR